MWGPPDESRAATSQSFHRATARSTRVDSTHMFDFVVVVLDALLDDGVVAGRHLFQVLVD